tara:strand:+ start:522 stop:1790 length:1269 start_codon:yes stop_codon:yes gene_type:complete
MAITNTTNFDAALKQIYSASNVANTTLTNRPLLALLPKRTDFGGRNMPLVNIYGDPQGRSANFTNARDNASQVSMDGFLLTRVSNYSVAKIGSEAAEASKGDSMAFLSALKASIDGAMNALSNSLETELFRSGTGVIGVIAAGGVTGSVGTLTEAESITNFNVNQNVVFSDVDGGVVRSVTPLTITAVNRTLGTFTTSAAFSTVGGVAGDFIYTEGDTNATAGAVASSRVAISGLDAWLPSSAPSGGESFFGVDRSVDSRLYGQYLNASGYAAATAEQDALIDAASLSARSGGTPDIAFINHTQMRNMIKNLVSSQQYNQVNAVTHKQVVADVGFRSVNITADTGQIDVVAAAKCPAESGYVLEKKTWILASLGETVKFLNLDGNKILRSADADSLEARLAFRGNLGCKAPIHNVRVLLAAV